VATDPLGLGVHKATPYSPASGSAVSRAGRGQDGHKTSLIRIKASRMSNEQTLTNYNGVLEKPPPPVLF
jgi:hypothetical protein